jgi:CheY-like chemotaxis protein
LARILIADDDDALTTTWRLALEREGHKVVTQASGLGALSSVHREPPDLLLAELATPGVGGLALAGRIKLASAHTKVIVTTGHPAMLDPYVDAFGLARQAGADRALIKPVSLKTLIETVRGLLADFADAATQ